MDEAERRQLDEMVDRITGTHAAPTVDEGRVETFGHAVVDEAQDLTPMQWRVLRRRVPSGSMTIVGDLGQAKYSWSSRSWPDIAGLAAPDTAVSVLELDVNYRTPQEAMDLGAAVLRAIDPSLRPPRSVRRVGTAPVVVSVERDALTRARQLAAEEAAAVDGGRVAIVVPPELAVPASPSVLDEVVAELGVEDVKGLEFDSVIVVEPAAFDLGSLYVALTRTTNRLTIVHEARLPAAVTRR
jgi:DNA helicase IV